MYGPSIVTLVNGANVEAATRVVGNASHAAEIRNKSILRTWTKRAPAFILVSPRRRSIAVERRQSLGAARPLLNRSFFRRVLRSKPKVYGLVRLTRNERLKMNRKREAVNKKALCAAGESRSHYGGIRMWGRLPRGRRHPLCRHC